MEKLAFLLGAALSLGCGASSQGRIAGHARAGDEESGRAWAEACMHSGSEPVRVSYAPAPNGASVSFTTRGDADRLRERVLELARLHNTHSTYEPEMHSLRDLPHTARYQETTEGATITLVAAANNDSDVLRRHVQQDVLSMQRKGCEGAHELL